MNTWIKWGQKLADKSWCWIVGHDTIRTEFFVQTHDATGSYPHTTTAAYKCLRCGQTWHEQHDS